MKTKITILLITLFVLAFSAQAFSDEKAIALIDGADTRGVDTVEHIQVQLTAEIDYTSFTWTSSTWDDFTIIDGATNIAVTSITNTGLELNLFRVYFTPQVPPFGPDKDNLKLDYKPTGSSTLIPCTNGAYVQYTADPVDVADGIAPTITLDATNSNHTLAPKLAVRNDIITVEFSANEDLLISPAPVVQIFGDSDNPCTAEATQVVDQQHWKADVTISDLTHAEGLISVKITCKDLWNNQTILTEDSDVMYKDSDPTTTYVDDDWNNQVDVTATDPNLIWQWDAFKTVQDGIDGLADTGTLTVNVYAGTYAEDLVIDKTLELLPYYTAKAYDVVTLKGMATVAAASWPLAAPNIDIQATGVSIHNFKIEAPDYVSGFYSSGIVVGATNATIYNNAFYANYVNSTDDISQSIQTYETVDVSGLNIYTNNFMSKADKISYWGYEGIYINPGGTGNVNIEANTFGDACFRAITTLRSNVTIDGNNINTNQAPVPDDWSNPGAWVGIWAYGNISDVVITGNTVQGNVGGAGFNRGIRLGHTGGSTFTNLSVTSNKIYYNKNGIYSQSATGITITGNAIVNNTAYGIFCDTGMLDAENNWWGSTNGPDHVDNTFNVTAQGDASSDHVDYVPWYDTGMTGTSFAPVHSDDGVVKAITYFSSIQTALDAAASGATLTCQAGTFDEQFNIEVSNLTLKGVSNTTVIIQPSAPVVAGDYDVEIGQIGGVNVDNVKIHTLQFDLNGAADDRAGVGICVSDMHAPPGQIAPNVTNVEIYNNIFYGGDGSTCIVTGKYAVVGGLNVHTNVFHGDATGSSEGIYINPRSDIGVINLNYNNFDGYVFSGISIEADYVNATYNVVNNNNALSKYGIRVVDYDGSVTYNNIDISYNDIDNFLYGMRIGSSATLASTLAPAIEHNTINGCDVGIWVRADADPSVHYNDISGNTSYGIKNDFTTNIDAENNWWGSGSGPDHVDNTFTNPAGDPHGDAATNYVDYVPWYDTDMTGIPFAPVELYAFNLKLDKNKLREENLSFKDVIKDKDDFEQFSSIQTAIDAYNDATYDWAGIFCYAGTFTEDFVAYKDSILFFTDVTKQNVTLLGDQEVTGNYVYFGDFEFDPQAGVALLLNSTAAPIDVTLIDGCTFTIDESGDVGIYVGGSASPNAVTDTYIENCIFNGPTADKNSNPFKVGGWFGTNIGCEIDTLVFYNNEVNYGSIPINLVDENVTDIYIGYNDFLNTDGVIYFWNDSGTPPNGELSYFDFSNNYVPSSNSYGIAIGGASLGGPIFTDINFGPGNAINDNFLEPVVKYGYGAVYMADQYTGLLDASTNWWGDQYGPLNDNNTYTPPAGPKGRATVSDRVEFAPWYNDGTDAALDRGWVPLSPPEDYLFAPVINVTQTTYHSSIQRGVDAASGGDVLTCIAGTFTEDVAIDKTLEIRPNGTAKAYDDVTIKGVRTEPVGSWPLATENIDIAANGVKIHHFTIESPTIADGYYSSGIVLNGIDINIYDNDFVIDGTSTHDSRAVCIQTRRIDVFPTACVDGLLIQDNTFGGVIGTRGYYGIYINRDNNSGTVTITENELTGRMRAGIANERSNVVISNNSFDGGGATWTGENINGMWIIDWDITRTIDNVDITGNTITNFASDGIELGWSAAGPTYQTLTDIVVSGNTITGNDKGIKVASGAGGISVNYNNISGNTNYGAENTHTALLDATKNWWGDATGPDDDNTPPLNPHTTPLGDNVSVGVTFIPWYATSTVTTATEYVMTHGDITKAIVPLAYADAIQPGINAAAGNYYYVRVTDDATPYTENLTVDNQAYIYGYEGVHKATPPVKIIGTHVITGDNATFDNFILTPGAGVSGTVITINSASQIINGTSIEDCQFDIDTSPSIGVYVGGGTPTNAVANTGITDCTFNGPANKISNPFKVGGSFGSPVGCEIAGLSFMGNYVNYGSIPINLADKDILGLSMYYNDFANTDGVIYFWAEAGSKSPTGMIAWFNFYYNYVDYTNSYGVGFDVNGNFTSLNYGPEIYINENYFGKNIPGAYGFDAVSILTPTADLAGYVLDATNNWWGSEDGPSHSSNTFNVPTQGVAVSDNVDFVRWYDSELFHTDPGWAPLGNLFAPVRVAVPKAKAHPYYASIQAAINSAPSHSDIICYAAPSSGTGKFYEDFSVPASKTNLKIHPFNHPKAYDNVTIKGQATVESSLWPLAGPNIEILGAGTSLEHFTIEAPDYVVGYYSSGIVVGATNVDINYNTFNNNAVDNTDDISQSIQTYEGVDCSTLDIKENAFTDNVFKATYDWGYEGIYINPGCGSSYIYGNYFLGMCLRAITIEDAGASNILGNNIQTSMAPVPDSWATPGAYQGINLQGNLSNIEIVGNYIGGNNPAAGFAQGIRLGSTGNIFTNVTIGGPAFATHGNTIKYNSYGILCKSASGVSINHNIIEGNAFGVQNDDTTVKTVLDATYNWWGAADGPSFTFDYGIGSGSGDEVSEYVDFHPWYQDAALTTEYIIIMNQFLLSINPASPYVDNYFDLRVCAADAAGIRDFSYGNLADFSSSHVALSVPEEQLLVDGFKEIVGGCISALPFVAGDHLTIYAWQYNTNPPVYYSNLTDIVIQELNNPAPPDPVNFTDLPNDNGGWIMIEYTLSIDDPFYTLPIKDNYGVSYYVVEIDTIAASGQPDYHFLATIACYDDGSGTNDYTALLPAPASDTKYNFRMASVYNPTKLGGFDENHISYTEIASKDGGAQSTWQTGSAAPMDNLPAYANMNMFLEGPYQAGGTMIDGLTLPTISPYGIHEDIGTLPTVAGRTLIDWIYIELRNTATGATVKEANAFVLDNGMIVDTEGNYSLPFYYTTNVEYYLVIHHRNHLDIMSASTHTFGDFESQATTIDLTTVGTAYLNGFKEVDTGVYAMYDGDANGSELVNVNDAYDLINHFGMAGYLGSDLNLSGYVNVNDAYELIDNFGVGSSVPGSTLKGDLNDWQNIDFNVPITTGDKVIECTLEIKDVQVVSGVSYSFDVYITRNTSNWTALGHLTFLTETYYSELVFNYNGSALNNPVVSNLSPVATGTNVTTPSSGVLAIEVIDGGINVPVSETKLLTVTFDITDPAATSQLSWRTGDTSIINESSNSYNTAAGTLSPIGSDDSTLPVELSSFNALFSAANDNIELNWNTATENNVLGFNIYRSDVKDLTRAGRHINYSLITAAGTTTEPQSYIYSDVVGDVYTTHYYWLEVVDFGGTSSFHGPYGYTPGDIDGDSTPDLIASTQLLGNFPNPAINSTQIRYQLKGTVIDQNATISVYNVRGELVKTLNGRNGVATLDTSDMGHGIYFYRLQTDDYSDIKKLIVIK